MDELFLELYLEPQKIKKEKENALKVLLTILPYDIAYYIIREYY